MKNKKQDMEYFLRLGEQAGFTVIQKEKQDHIFKITFRK